MAFCNDMAMERGRFCVLPQPVTVAWSPAQLAFAAFGRHILQHILKGKEVPVSIIFSYGATAFVKVKLASSSRRAKSWSQFLAGLYEGWTRMPATAKLLVLLL